MTDQKPSRPGRTPAAGKAAPTQTIRTRVVIVGGGLAGLTLAARLGGLEIDTVVVDREPVERRLEHGFDIRTTALSYGSRLVMQSAGLWEPLRPDASPILDIRIADASAPVFLHFDHREVAERSGGEPFGHIVDNSVIRRAQVERLNGMAAVRHLSGVAVTAVELGVAAATVTLDDGRRIGAELVVGADGRGSFVREAAGIGARRWSYRQTALVFAMTHALPHDGIAVEHFMPAGPFAVLPMTDDAEGRHRSSIVWTERPEEAKRLLALKPEVFDRELQAKVGEWLGPVSLAGRRATYPLGVLHADAYVADRVALVGESAHGIHPIAGQGLNLSLRDIDALQAILDEKASLGLDLGALDGLRRYERARRPDNVAMLTVTDGLNRLFSTGFTPVQAIRDAGLVMVGRLPPVKRFFMLQAMGLAGRAPDRG